MRYIPHTEEEVRAMLATVGAPSVDALFSMIPAELRAKEAPQVPVALGEPALMRHMEQLAASSKGVSMLSFLGGGSYDHHIPPAVDQLISRSEFYTAYTPYQPEVSQGTLQSIFEFQTLVSELLGLPVANASMYDGASATAEAVLMARRLTRRERVILSESLHPEYTAVVETYLRTLGVPPTDILHASLDSHGLEDEAALRSLATDSVAAVVVGYPTFYGTVGDLRAVARLTHDAGALLVTATSEPYALALIESPGALGADIAVGEGQPLACPPQFGGPGVGLFACKESRENLQQLPGRLCGQTVDKTGKLGYVLTLVTREQFIRRERATSNICTNQGLMALAMTIRCALLGRSGFLETASQCLAKAEYLKLSLARVKNLQLVYPSTPTFNELLVRLPRAADQVVQELASQGVLAGVSLTHLGPPHANDLLVAVTEKHSRADLDSLVEKLRRAVG